MLTYLETLLGLLSFVKVSKSELEAMHGFLQLVDDGTHTAHYILCAMGNRFAHMHESMTSDDLLVWRLLLQKLESIAI